MSVQVSCSCSHLDKDNLAHCHTCGIPLKGPIGSFLALLESFCPFAGVTGLHCVHPA